MTTPTAELWTTRRLLAWMTDAFSKKKLDSPRLSAELLLSHVIGCERLRLYMDPDRPASPLERDTLRDLVGRALKNEPVQYLVGTGWFFGLPFTVDDRVLVPRPSTESIVESVLQHARTQPGFGRPDGDGLMICDLCTGSGCIPIALLKNLPGARAVAVDISPDALEVARENAERHKVADRLDLVLGDLFDPIRDYPSNRRFHYITANPPYVADNEWDEVPANVKDYEPHVALRGGADGLDVARRIFAEAPSHLRHAGMLLVEVGSAGADAALALAAADPTLESARIVQDCDGLPRVVVARSTRNHAEAHGPAEPANPTNPADPGT